MAHGHEQARYLVEWDDASKFRTLADSIDEGFCVIESIFDEHGRGVDYRFLEVNRVFESQTGLRDSVGKRMYELAPDHELFWAETYGRVAQSGEAVRFEHRAKALNRWYDVFAFRVGDPAERKVAMLFQDITARVHARMELSAEDRRKSEFMVTLAHELRNPLAPMRTAVAIARRAKRLEDVEGPLRILERQIDYLTTLISDLSDLGQVARGLVELKLAELDLRDVAHQAAEIARPAMEVREQRFEELLCDVVISVRGDARRLAQALSNLLLNASKYTPPGGRIALSIRAEGAFAVMEVVDDGIGIPEDQLGDIFGLFSQVNQAKEHSQGGLGVGLAVAKHVAQLHGGRIEAFSDGPGRGSTFRLAVPIFERPQTVPLDA